MDKKIFTLINQSEARQQLFLDLSQARVELTCKGKNESICSLKVNSYNRITQTLTCKVNTDANLENSERILVYFFLGGEKYFFMQQVLFQGGFYYLKLPREIFRLERRQAFRIKIPFSHSMLLHIAKLNEEPKAASAQVQEISSSGCRIKVDKYTLPLKKGDIIASVLHCIQLAPFELQCEIIHAKTDPIDKKFINCGVKFINFDKIIENKLFSLTMELHKELYR